MGYEREGEEVEYDEDRFSVDNAALDRALAVLSDHFDAVTIFVSRFNTETGNTVSSWKGRGNWHARHGQVRDWIVKQDAIAREEAKRDAPDE